MTQRDWPVFSSRLASILTFAGIAIGLGNVWRFPYMMGSNGGSAFLLLYLIFMLLLAVPAVMAEWALGRASRTGPVAAYQKSLGTRFGTTVGLLIIFALAVADSYYIVTIANIAYTGWFSASQGFSEANLPAYQSGLSDSLKQGLISIAILTFSIWIVTRGLKRGMEAISRLFVPFFGVIAVYLIYKALNLDGSLAELREFLKPDFSKINAEVAFAAMGQACFSIGLGGAISVIYGSYLKPDQPLVPTAIATGFMDTGAALLASLFIVPAVLVFGIDLAGGPGLIFDTLPRLFMQMPEGRLLSVLFLTALVSVALLSAIAPLEAVVAGLQDVVGEKFSRGQIIAFVAVLEVMLMLPSLIDPNVIGLLDLVFGSGMFIFGSMMAVIALCWGLGVRMARSELIGNSTSRWSGYLVIWLRYVVPLCLSAILIGYIVSKI